jgi:putative hemolysin
MRNQTTNISAAGRCFPALILLLASAMTASALRNPAAVYCSALGYGYSIKETPKGQVGVCMPDPSVECDEWDFLRGKCGMDYSFCAKSGYSRKAAKGLECGGSDPFAECLLCVLPEGGEVEVTELMGLSFEDDAGGIAKDTINQGCIVNGACEGYEDPANCPQDCAEPVGAAGNVSGTGQPLAEEVPASKGLVDYFFVLVSFVVFLVVVFFLLVRFKRS